MKVSFDQSSHKLVLEKLDKSLSIEAHRSLSIAEVGLRAIFSRSSFSILKIDGQTYYINIAELKDKISHLERSQLKILRKDIDEIDRIISDSDKPLYTRIDQVLLVVIQADRRLDKDEEIELFKACQDGDNTTIERLTKAPRVVEPEIFEACIKKAAENNKKGSLTLLLEKHNLDSEKRGKIIRILALKGSIEVIQALYTKELKPEDLYCALTNSAEHGHVDLCRWIQKRINEDFNDGVSAVERDRNICIAMSRALAINKKEIISLLLAKPFNFRSMNPVIKSALINRSAENNWIDILEILKENRISIPKAMKDEAIRRCSDPRCKELIESFYEQRDRIILLPISLTEVKENPLFYLDYINTNGFPDHFELPGTEGAAVDVGGITKQFVTVLIEAFIEKHFLSDITNSIPQIIKDEDIKYFERLGRFFSLIYEKNLDRSDKLLTGNLFHPDFFKFVALARFKRDDPEAKKEAIKKTAELLKECDPTLEKLVEVVLNPTKENKSELAEILGCEIKDASKEAKQTIANYLNAAIAFYNGADRMLREAIAGGRHDRIELLKSIQGEPVTKEDLISSLRIDRDSYESNPWYRDKIDWIIEKLESSTPEFQKQFLFAITGKSTYAAGTTINIFNNPESEDTLAIHVCTSTVDLPDADIDKEAFLEALEATIQSHEFNTR